MTYQIIEQDGATRRLTETFFLRLVYRFELEHLLARSGFRLVRLYGDYDRSAFASESVGMIAVALRGPAITPDARSPMPDFTDAGARRLRTDEAQGSWMDELREDGVCRPRR